MALILGPTTTFAKMRLVLLVVALLLSVCHAREDPFVLGPNELLYGPDLESVTQTTPVATQPMATDLQLTAAGTNQMEDTRIPPDNDHTGDLQGTPASTVPATAEKSHQLHRFALKTLAPSQKRERDICGPNNDRCCNRVAQTIRSYPCSNKANIRERVTESRKCRRGDGYGFSCTMAMCRALCCYFYELPYCRHVNSNKLPFGWLSSTPQPKHLPSPGKVLSRQWQKVFREYFTSKENLRRFPLAPEFVVYGIMASGGVLGVNGVTGYDVVYDVTTLQVVGTRTTGASANIGPVSTYWQGAVGFYVGFGWKGYHKHAVFQCTRDMLGPPSWGFGVSAGTGLFSAGLTRTQSMAGPGSDYGPSMAWVANIDMGVASKAWKRSGKLFKPTKTGASVSVSFSSSVATYTHQFHNKHEFQSSSPYDSLWQTIHPTPRQKTALTNFNIVRRAVDFVMKPLLSAITKVSWNVGKSYNQCQGRHSWGPGGGGSGYHNDFYGADQYGYGGPPYGHNHNHHHGYHYDPWA